MPREWQFSSIKMTVWVQTECGIITDAATVVRRFVGQPMRKLAKWMSQQGGFRIEVLRGTDE